MTIDAELSWWERYAEANPIDQRRALYGRAVFDLTRFIMEHAAEYDGDVYALRVAADQHFRALLEATLGLAQNLGAIRVPGEKGEP